MKIIVTGATGSLGAILTRYFSSQGHEVIAIGRMKNPPDKLLSYAKYYRTDITHPYSLPDADICIHTAALSDDKGSKSEFYNVNGTRNTLTAASSCRKFIHISSSSVYLPSDNPLPETIAGKQNNKQLSNYGFSKLLTEEMLIETSRFESCYILRPRAHYGCGDKVILPRLLKLVKNKEIHRPGSMKVDISLTHYDNMIHAVECCLQSGKNGINIYNVSDERSYVFIEIIRKLTRALYGQELPEKQMPIALLKAMAIFKLGGITPLLVRSFTRNMVLDISKIKEELNYKPVTDFYASLNDLTQWVNKIGGVDVIKTGDKKLAWEY
jgi:nucleoside-diphosphate-sugar epimerase